MVSGLGGATRCRCFLVDLSGVLPIRRATVIVERGLTAHLEFDGAADAFDRTEKGVFGIPVGRCALVRVRSLVDVVPGVRTSVGKGKSVSVRLHYGGRGYIKKKKT